MCIRFNTGHFGGFVPLVMPVEVKYRDVFPDNNFFTANTYDFVHTVLGTKASAWSHEHEWRLVFVNHVGEIRIPSQAVDGVILGMRTTPDIEATVRGWINRSRPRIELLRVRHKPNNFELSVGPA